MRATERISVEVPAALAAAMRARVMAGRFASESEAVTAALAEAEERERDLDAWLRLARVCEAANDPGAALDALRQALASVRAPEPRARLLAHVGRLEEARGRIEAALVAYEAALVLVPAQPEIALQVAEMRAARGVSCRAFRY